MRNPRTAAFALAGATALLLTACGEAESGSGDGGLGHDPASLMERRWVLSELNGEDAGSIISDMQFDAGPKVSGNSGCNRYSGSVKTLTDKGELTFGPLISTKMACPEPQMKREQAFLGALGKTASFEVGEETLVLNGAGGTALARFTLED